MDNDEYPGPLGELLAIRDQLEAIDEALKRHRSAGRHVPTGWKFFRTSAGRLVAVPAPSLN